ncbi:MAG: hypothetical protein LUQ71_02550 [Methanoregula sp.]|nr:hypothetical protein [Methanoregula sp.]
MNAADTRKIQVHPGKTDPGDELCPVGSERHIRHCTVCNKPYRSDRYSGSGELCPSCYYIVYADDDD